MEIEDQFKKPDQSAFLLPSSPKPSLPTPSYGDAIPENNEQHSPDDSQTPVPPHEATGNQLPNLLPYTHTVPQASSLMQERGCKFYSERKVQRLCSTGAIDCYRLQTTRNGKPVTEWLVNGNSLLYHIGKNEIMRDDTPAANVPVATPDLPLSETGAAKTEPGLPGNGEDIPDDSIKSDNGFATLNPIGDASVVTTEETSVANTPDDTGTSKRFGDATGGREVFTQSSEVELLIEKAVLRTQLEAKDTELKSIVASKDQEINYLRQEKRELRENEKHLQREVFELGKLSFKTFQNVSMGGVLDEPNEKNHQHNPSGQSLFGEAGDNPDPNPDRDGV